MVINPHIPKRKPHKPNAQQRAAQANWQEILRKYDVKPKSTSKNIPPSIHISTGSIRANCDSRIYPSLVTNLGNTGKKETVVYSGDAVIGISVLHKSNAVPVFSKEDIIDIAKMRRG